MRKKIAHMLRWVCLFGAGLGLFGEKQAIGQPNPSTNLELTQRLIRRVADSAGLVVSKYTGAGARWADTLATDSAGIPVQVTEPNVFLSMVSKTELRRVVQVTLAWGDTLPMLARTSVADTLTTKAWAWVRRNSPPEISGDDPRWAVRWLRPALLTAGSLGVVATLFYLRSPKP